MLKHAVGDIVLDERTTRVGRVTAIHGECLVLARSSGKPWSAVAGSCRTATSAEAAGLNAWRPAA
ncbi:hypothetical protein [Streptomyces sp. NPDC014733]|uniref:hypothetical protein n=1 Tax=Streptomyces sp. NPDC014733 TaxID=3364885 RepID=UPI0036FD5759